MTTVTKVTSVSVVAVVTCYHGYRAYAVRTCPVCSQSARPDRRLRTVTVLQDNVCNKQRRDVALTTHPAPCTCCTHKILRAYVRVHRAWFRMATKEMQISENPPHEYQQIHNNINTGRFITYSGITKNYYRKTAGHVFTKPVQIEGTHFFPPVSCLSS